MGHVAAHQAARMNVDYGSAPRITWRDRLSNRRMAQRMAEIRAWAHAEVQRTQPPVCDRPSCYDGPDVVVSRLAHGCVPDFSLLPVAPPIPSESPATATGPADYDG